MFSVLDLKRNESLIKFLFLLKPYWKNIQVFVLSNMIGIVLTLPLPWFSKLLIDDVMLKQNSSLLIVVVSSVFIITSANTVLGFLKNYYTSFVQHKMFFEIQLQFYKHLQRLTFSFYDSKEVAEVLSRFRDAAESRETIIDIINSFITNLLYLLIVPFIVFLMNWKLALIAGFTLPWMAFSFFILSKFVRKYSRLEAEKQAEMSAMNFETLSGIREIQSLLAENRILKRVKLIYLQYRKLSMIIRAFYTFEGLVSGIMTAVGTLLYTWYGATLVIEGTMTVGEFTAFSTFVGFLYNPLTEIVGLLVPIQEVKVSTKRFFEYYDIEPELEEIKKPVKLNRMKGHVSFSNVSFGYSPDKVVLHNISFEALPGQTVAIVGGTGSGKSTLANLIPRFYDPGSGAIRIDGIDLKNISINSLRSKIGFVRQTPFLFNSSVFDNLTAYARGKPKELIMKVAHVVQMHEVIKALPNGYNTKIGEHGTLLSGGEQQRIALARTILLNRPILILDEATSNLDLKTEAKIQGILKKLTKRKTIFIIAHRLSTIVDADLILVLDKGRLVEKGNHSELIERKGHYYELYTSRKPDLNQQ